MMKSSKVYLWIIILALNILIVCGSENKKLLLENFVDEETPANEYMTELVSLDIRKNPDWLAEIFRSQYLSTKIILYLVPPPDNAFIYPIAPEYRLSKYFLHEYVIYYSYVFFGKTQNQLEQMLESLLSLAVAEWTGMFTHDFKGLLTTASVSFSNPADKENDLRSLVYLQKIKFYHILLEYLHTERDICPEYRFLKQQLNRVVSEHLQNSKQCYKSRMSSLFYILKEKSDVNNVRVFTQACTRYRPCRCSRLPTKYIETRDNYIITCHADTGKSFGIPLMCWKHKLTFILFPISVVLWVVLAIFSIWLILATVYFEFAMLSAEIIFRGLIYISILGFLRLVRVISRLTGFGLSLCNCNCANSFSVKCNNYYNLISQIEPNIIDYIFDTLPYPLTFRLLFSLEPFFARILEYMNFLLGFPPISC